MNNLLFIIIFLISPAFIAGAGIKEQAEGIIKQHLGQEVGLEFEKYRIPAAIKMNAQKQSQQRFYRDFIYLWKTTQNDTVVGFATLDNVRAKSAVITVLVIFNIKARVNHVEILKYVGLHGRNVQDQEWLNQFIGKKTDSDFAPGSGINAVSGATFSAAAVSKGIKKWCALIQSIHNSN